MIREVGIIGGWGALDTVMIINNGGLEGVEKIV